jgi:hypothetical protein
MRHEVCHAGLDPASKVHQDWIADQVRNDANSSRQRATASALLLFKHAAK